MRKGLKYFITEEHGLIQMIDYWAYLCEIQEDYEGWIYTNEEKKNVL